MGDLDCCRSRRIALGLSGRPSSRWPTAKDRADWTRIYSQSTDHAVVVVINSRLMYTTRFRFSCLTSTFKYMHQFLHFANKICITINNKCFRIVANSAISHKSTTRRLWKRARGSDIVLWPIWIRNVRVGLIKPIQFSRRRPHRCFSWPLHH